MLTASLYSGCSSSAADDSGHSRSVSSSATSCCLSPSCCRQLSHLCLPRGRREVCAVGADVEDQLQELLREAPWRSQAVLVPVDSIWNRLFLNAMSFLSTCSPVSTPRCPAGGAKAPASRPRAASARALGVDQPDTDFVDVRPQADVIAVWAAMSEPVPVVVGVVFHGRVCWRFVGPGRELDGGRLERRGRDSPAHARACGVRQAKKGRPSGGTGT